MSTWILDKKHFDHVAPLFLPFYAAPGATREEQLTHIGRQLMRENNASFRHNYGDRHPGATNDAEAYVWEKPNTPAEDPFFDLKALHCLRYQCCDRYYTTKGPDGKPEYHTIWDDTELLAAMSEADKALIAACPGGPWRETDDGDAVNAEGESLYYSDGWNRADAWPIE